MNYDFLKLDFIVLDASAVFTIDADLLSELLKHPRIYVAKTFNCECAQYLQLATPAEKGAYQRNSPEIRKAQLKMPPYSSIPMGIDAYEVVKYIASQDVDVVLISSNKLLIERLVLDEIEAYAYDPRTKELHRYYKYAEEKSSHEFTTERYIIESGCVINSGFTIWSDTGAHYTLGSKYADGTEAVIYQIKEKPSFLAKVYKPKMITAEKARNIENLIAIGKTINAAWCPFPVELLYSHSDKKHPVGYLMAFKKDMKLLSDILLYNGDVSNILPDFRDVRISDTVDLCIGIVQRIAYLNSYGVLVTDFNDKNFALSGNGINSNALFLDADSFCYGNYLSDCRAPYSDDEYTRIYNFSELSKSEAIAFSFESLCILVFKLLTLGSNPIFNGKFKFRSNRTIHDNDFRWSMVPDSVKQVFTKAFEEKKMCSTSELLYALVEAKNTLQHSRSTNCTYLSICDRFIYATNADDLGENFTGVFFSLDEMSHRRVITGGISSPNVSEEKWTSEEVLTFKRNSDGTYCIMSSSGNGFLSVSGGYDNPILSFSATCVSLSEKWRIERLSVSNDSFGHPVYKCFVGSEILPQLVLSVENNTKLRMHSTYEDSGFNNNLCICNVTAETHCNDKRIAVYRPPTQGFSSSASNTSFSSKSIIDKAEDWIEETWEKIKEFCADTFKPSGGRWDTIGKPVIIVAAVLLLLVLLFSSCVGCGCASPSSVDNLVINTSTAEFIEDENNMHSHTNLYSDKNIT